VLVKKVRENKELYSKKLEEYRGERKKRILKKVNELRLALWTQDDLSKIPRSLIKPSNHHPFKRAEIDGDLRLYWWIEKDTLVLHDICTHKEAKSYGDVHK
jgi:hypothetical protein